MTTVDFNEQSGEEVQSLASSQTPGLDLPNADKSSKGPSRSESAKRIGFFLLNCWLVFHLFAIFVGPASGDPSSSLTLAAYESIAPYLHLLYLDHGFHYFVPEPGPSTLVAYELEFPDGTTKTGQIPNREMFPRLYYHRHFMVTEFLGNGPDEFQPLVARAIARNLCRESGAARVKLTRITHEMASVDDIRRGLSLNDSKFFKEMELGTFTVDELQTPFVFPTRPAHSESEVQDQSASESSTARAADLRETP